MSEFFNLLIGFTFGMGFCAAIFWPKMRNLNKAFDEIYEDMKDER